MKLPLLLLLCTASTLPALPSLQAQDIGQQIAIQNQINQQVMLSQQATQQAMQDNMQAMQAAQAANQPYLTCEACQPASTPQVTIPAGAYPGPITIKLKSKTRRAQIFYTTDGWTPSIQSIPYTGPITLSSNSTLQVIALAPGFAHSKVRVLTYTFPAGPAAPAPVTSANGLPPQGTPLPLRFTAALDSTNAFVGQTFDLALASDLVVNGKIVAPAGTKAQGTVTAVDPPGRVSAPGILTFTVKSITIAGTSVPLSATRTREGRDESNRQFLTLIPVAGPLSLLHKGQSAHIDPGAELIATVAATPSTVAAAN